MDRLGSDKPWDGQSVEMKGGEAKRKGDQNVSPKQHGPPLRKAGVSIATVERVLYAAVGSIRRCKRRTCVGEGGSKLGFEVRRGSDEAQFIRPS